MAKDGTNSPKKKRDNLEAARIVRDALDGFPQEQQAQILRWAAESLGLSAAASAPSAPEANEPKPKSAAAAPEPPAVPPKSPAPSGKDVKTFVDAKDPQTDIHLATAVAYYYGFEAPEAERKSVIDAKFLRDALRRAGRPGALVNPQNTLNNAQKAGLLDRNSPGKFTINSVGENLVGMTLPMKSVGKKPSNK
jgi:hypothetical protein